MSVDRFREELSRLLGFEINIEVSTRNSRDYNKLTDEMVPRLMDNFPVQILISDENYDEAARFSLDQMPGCCGIVVVHSQNNEHPVIEEKLASFKKDLAYGMGYTTIMWNYVNNKPPEDWTNIHSLVNRRTGNTIHISVCAAASDE